MTTIDFWFDALSPYAWLAFDRLPQALEGQSVAVNYQPVLLAGMLAHWEQALTDIGFLDPSAPKKLMPRLNQLFNRADLNPEEIHILRGVAKAMSANASAKR